MTSTSATIVAIGVMLVLVIIVSGYLVMESRNIMSVVKTAVTQAVAMDLLNTMEDCLIYTIFNGDSCDVYIVLNSKIDIELVNNTIRLHVHGSRPAKIDLDELSRLLGRVAEKYSRNISVQVVVKNMSEVSIIHVNSTIATYGATNKIFIHLWSETK